MKTNTEFKRIALDSLRGNWGKAVIATLVYVLILTLISTPAGYSSFQLQNQMNELVGNTSAMSIQQAAGLASMPEYIALQNQMFKTNGITTLLQLFIILPLGLGFVNAFRRLVVHADSSIILNTFSIGFRNYWHNVWGMLVMGVLIFLWSLLFFIPGVIKTFSYAMTPYILHENPELSAREAIHRSRMMMRGHKFDLFWLYLSFIGWFCLSLLSFGIGLFWLVPYVESAEAAFYEEVKADYAINGGLD